MCLKKNVNKIALVFMTGFIFMFLILTCEKEFIPISNQAITCLPGDTVTLSIGEVAYFQHPGAYIRFDTITEDSRCPINVYCFWPGQVTARFIIQNRAGQTEQIEILSPGSKDLQNLVAGVDLKLLQVLPYPVYPERILPEEYKVVIFLSYYDIQYVR